MNRFRFIITLLAAAIIMPAAFSQSKRDKDYKANLTFDAGEYADAVDLYKTAYNKVKEKSRKNEIVFKIAECYRLTRDPRKAEVWYKKAIRSRLSGSGYFPVLRSNADDGREL